MTIYANRDACLDCSGPVSRQSRTGRCRVCAVAILNASPAFAASRTAGIRRRYEDPAFRASKAKVIHARHMAARKDPATAERLNRNIWIARQRLNDPDVRAKFLAGRAAAGRKRSATVFKWCPPNRVEEYRSLTRSKRMSAAEARRMIEETMTPFEHQLSRVRQGAGITDYAKREQLR